MENNERDRKLDQWLDEALSQYSAAEPRLGLEQRVLAHISAEQQIRAGHRNWWRWMPAFAAIAAVVIVAVAVKPYWEKQPTPAERPAETASVAPQNSAINVAGETAEKTDTAVKRSRNQSLHQKLEAPEVRRDGAIAIEADKRVAAKKDGMVVPSEPKPERETSTLTNSNEALQASDAAVADLKSPKSVPLNTRQSMNYFALPPTAGSDAAAAGRANAPVSAGAIANGKAPVAKPAKDPRTEIISVDGPHPVVQVQDQTVEVTTAAEKVTAVPEPTGAMRAMKVHANPKGPLAKKLEENVESGYSAGLVAGKELKKQSANSPKQFPSPAALTKEEQLMLSAAKNLKDADAISEKQKKTESDTSAVEIKKIEIAPLPGPPK